MRGLRQEVSLNWGWGYGERCSSSWCSVLRWKLELVITFCDLAMVLFEVYSFGRSVANYCFISVISMPTPTRIILTNHLCTGMLSLRASIIFFSSNDSFLPSLYRPVSNSF